MRATSVARNLLFISHYQYFRFKILDFEFNVLLLHTEFYDRETYIN